MKAGNYASNNSSSPPAGWNKNIDIKLIDLAGIAPLELVAAQIKEQKNGEDVSDNEVI